MISDFVSRFHFDVVDLFMIQFLSEFSRAPRTGEQPPGRLRSVRAPLCHPIVAHLLAMQGQLPVAHPILEVLLHTTEPNNPSSSRLRKYLLMLPFRKQSVR